MHADDHDDMDPSKFELRLAQMKEKSKTKGINLQVSKARCVELGIPVCLAPYLMSCFSQQQQQQQQPVHNQKVFSIDHLDTQSLLQMCKTIIDHRRDFKRAFQDHQDRQN